MSRLIFSCFYLFEYSLQAKWLLDGDDILDEEEDGVLIDTSAEANDGTTSDWFKDGAGSVFPCLLHCRPQFVLVITG